MTLKNDTASSIQLLKADWRANRGNPKARVVLVAFRLVSSLRGRGGVLKVIYLPLASIYKLLCEWVLGIELPLSTSVGPGLAIHHGFGLVVNPATRIGAGVTLRHGVTLGNNGTTNACPTIGDDVSVGVGATILGGVSVGNGARIGAHALVIRDVPSGAVVVSAPAQPLVKDVSKNQQ